MAQKKLLVKDYMARRLTTLSPETEIMQAVHTLIDKDISGAPVVDDNDQLVGILTQKDCMKVVLNAAYHSEIGGIVADFMSTKISSLPPDMNLVEAAQCFLDQHYHLYPVLEDGALIGQISRRDILRALEDAWQWSND
jgi:CBS domain-containing protein